MTDDTKYLFFALVIGAAIATPLPAHAEVKTVVLVHGAFADGSGWKPIADILQSDGYSVRIVQEPETSFAADLAATIITELGIHPDVKSLVYISAFQPDVGESVEALSAKLPAANKSVGPVGDGFLAIDPDAFPSDFASDVPEPVARFMAISQVPIFKEIFAAKTTVAAWKQKRSYAVVSTQDRMISPDLERFMSKRARSDTIELVGSHAIFLSHPREVAALIKKAAMEAK
jgi:pimeloyl-ACP methyl ester carboxylesterase